MEWTQYTGPHFFPFDYPTGWNVKVTDAPSCVVSSPDRLWIALIQPLAIPADVTPVDVIKYAPQMPLFPQAVLTNVTPNDARSAEGSLTYRAVNGAPARAELVFRNFADTGILCAMAGPASEFDAQIPVLGRIIRSHNEAMLANAKPVQKKSEPIPVTPEPAPTPAVPPIPKGPTAGPAASGGVRPVSVFSTRAKTAAPVNYVRFTDPQLGSFTIDVPIGWQVRGGLNHPGLGDLRPWFEVNSPDGIYIISDPNFPQVLCHQALWFTGQVVDVGAGGRFLSLKPRAEGAADHYLKTVGKQALPNFVQKSRQPRQDAIDLVKRACAAEGVQMGWFSRISAVETILQRQGPGPAVTASLLSTCAFDGNYGIGIGFWSSLNVLCVAPADKAAVADAVRMQILRSFKTTPQMKQINQVDTQIIYNNAMEINRQQWQMFNAMQQAHYSQMAAGDAIVSNYWSQQRTNESIYRGWEQNQAVYDRLSQDRSDAMMGRQRLVDTAAGYEYDVEAGSNYYWRNPQTGVVFGTTTDQPPDYSNNYTPLQAL
jgi:hypothetical protein